MQKPKKTFVVSMVVCLLIVITMIQLDTSILVDVDDTQNNTPQTEELSVINKQEKTLEQASSETLIEHEKIETSLDEIDTLMSTQFQVLGFNIEESTNMQALFLEMDIHSLSDIQKAVGTGINELQSFVAVANGDDTQKFSFTVDKRKVIYAVFMDEDLYDSDNGGVLKQITDVHIPETKTTQEVYDKLLTMSENEIKSCLNFSDTADFSSLSWAVGRSDNKYKIVGEVSAKNGFGVKSDMSFGVWFIENGGEFTVEGVQINGERIK